MESKDDNYSEKNAFTFVSNFLSDVNKTLSQNKQNVSTIGGGKRKRCTNKRCKKSKKTNMFGAGKNDSPILPTPLPANVISQLEQIKQSTEKKTLNIVPNQPGIQELQLPTQLHNKLQGIISKLNQSQGSAVDINFTEDELLAVSLYANLLNLVQVKMASKIVNQNANESQQITQDVNDTQQLSGTLTQPNFIESVTENTNKEVDKIVTLYDNNAKPQEISSAALSAFLNAFARLGLLLKLMVNYKETFTEFNENMKTTKPKLHFLVSTVYSCISFILFTIFRLFTFIMSWRIGQLYIMIVFIMLYGTGNPIVVFIADNILSLIKITLNVTLNVTGASEFVNNSMILCEQKVIESIPYLLKSSLIDKLLTATINTVGQSAILQNMINSLGTGIANKVSETVINEALPVLKDSVITTITQGFQEITPLVENAVNQGIQSSVPLLENAVQNTLSQGLIEFTPRLVETLQPLILTGVTEGVTEGVKQEVVPMMLEGFRQLAIENTKTQFKGALFQNGAKLAFNYGVSWVAGYLGADATQVLAITNSGGKRTKKLKRKNKSNKIKKLYVNHRKR